APQASYVARDLVNRVYGCPCPVVINVVHSVWMRLPVLLGRVAESDLDTNGAGAEYLDVFACEATQHLVQAVSGWFIFHRSCSLSYQAVIPSSSIQYDPPLGVPVMHILLEALRRRV